VAAFSTASGPSACRACATTATLKQILIEKFLIQADDGWIFRGARSYRGAFQAEDEEASANHILLAMAADPIWRSPSRYALLREAVRWFPRESQSATATQVRQLAVVIADKDTSFAKLRAKIHNAPDAGDAQSVRDYAKTSDKAQLAVEYETIAAAIDELYAPRGAADALEVIADETKDPEASRRLRDAATALGEASTATARFGTAAKLLREFRDLLPKSASAEGLIALLRASIVIEGDAFVAGSAILQGLGTSTRMQRLGWLEQTGSALYGAGFISDRHLRELRSSVERTGSNASLNVDGYREELRYLARAPEWAARWLAFDFSLPVAKIAEIEPLAHLSFSTQTSSQESSTNSSARKLARACAPSTRASRAACSAKQPVTITTEMASTCCQRRSPSCRRCRAS